MHCRNKIRFILDGETIEVEDVDPTRTVLQYLREDIGRLGSKEGCAEGDCGACTVVLAELDRSGAALQIRAINSCIQFLPTLDGKELITVESLVDAGGRLPPFPASAGGLSRLSVWILHAWIRDVAVCTV